MKRLGIVLLGLALVLPQTLLAQTYAPDLQHGSMFQYTFSQGSGVSVDWDGVQAGPYLGKVGWNTPTAPSFSLYCIDYDHSIQVGNQVNARVSTLGTGDVGRTRLGMAGAAQALERYKTAAWLASQYHVAGTAHWSAIQTAIWTVTAVGATPWYGTDANVTGPGDQNWMHAARRAIRADFYGMDFNNWHVLTSYEKGRDGPILGKHQEMLTQTQSVVPEPETYVLLFSGLLFVGFFGRRRMKEMGYL